MSIHDFHSKLLSRNENSVLLEALRQLRRIEDVRGLLFDSNTSASGWNPWGDCHENHQDAVAGA